MRKFLFLLSLALTLLAGQTASATPELFLVTGGTSTTVFAPGPVIAFSNSNFGGWDITRIFGTSDSPATNNPFGLNLSVMASCSGGLCDTNPLHVWMSDTGFTDKNTAFDNIYMGTATGATSQTAWVGPGNILFQSNGADGPPTVAGGPLISLVSNVVVVGTIGAIQSPFARSLIGGPAAGPSPYSLTIEDIFTPGQGQDTFNTVGEVTAAAVPEPASVVLLGGYVLLFCASRLRRRRV
jgi:hypothetical protein